MTDYLKTVLPSLSLMVKKGIVSNTFPSNNLPCKGMILGKSEKFVHGFTLPIITGSQVKKSQLYYLFVQLVFNFFLAPKLFLQELFEANK